MPKTNSITLFELTWTPSSPTPPPSWIKLCLSSDELERMIDHSSYTSQMKLIFLRTELEGQISLETKASTGFIFAKKNPAKYQSDQTSQSMEKRTQKTFHTRSAFQTSDSLYNFFTNSLIKGSNQETRTRTQTPTSCSQSWKTPLRLPFSQSNAPYQDIRNV